MVVPPERRATLQTARKGASRKGFDALPPDFMLRALQMRYGHSTRRASRIRANASETRLMGNVEIGSSLIVCGDAAYCVTKSPGAGIEQAKDCRSSPRRAASRSNALGRRLDQGSDGD